MLLLRCEDMEEAVLDFQFVHRKIHTGQIAAFDIIARLVPIKNIRRNDFDDRPAAAMFGMHNLQTRPVARHFEGGADFTQLIVLTLGQPESAYVAVRLKIVRGDISRGGVGKLAGKQSHT